MRVFCLNLMVSKMAVSIVLIALASTSLTRAVFLETIVFTKTRAIFWLMQVRGLRWLVRARADIRLRPSEVIKPRTGIKLQPSALVRIRTDIKLRPIGLVRSYKD